MSNVVKLELVEVGADFRFDAGQLLEAAKGARFERMAIIGRLECGQLYVAGTANAGETTILLEQAKHMLIFGRDAAAHGETP